MANVVRTLMQLLGIWVDNTTGAITAQDGRDFIYSTFGYEAVTNPTSLNDNVDTAGIGAFFDCGSRWQNTATGRQYFCSSGAPGAAVWWVMMYDGEPAGGALGGAYPNPSIANTGVTSASYGDATHYPTFSVNPAGQLTVAGQMSLPSPGTGTVSSVGLSLPAEFSVSGSPVTTSGTLAGTWATQTANRVFAGPTGGGAATPAFRALVTADLPAGLGTVTSVGLTVPGHMSVSGSPVTGAGTLAVSLNTQLANTFFAGPTSGGAAIPAFRSLVAGDLPSGTAVWSEQDGIAAAGTNLAGATQLVAANNQVTSVSAGNTGVKLPDYAGAVVYVVNKTGGASSITVYPPNALAKFDNLAAGAGQLVGVNVVFLFIRVSATQWWARQM